MITFEDPQFMWTNPSKKSRQGSDPPPILAMPVFWELLVRQPIPKLKRRCLYLICLYFGVFRHELYLIFNKFSINIPFYHQFIVISLKSRKPSNLEWFLPSPWWKKPWPGCCAERNSYSDGRPGLPLPTLVLDMDYKSVEPKFEYDKQTFHQ